MARHHHPQHLNNEVYKPHPHTEAAALVTPEVAVRLDPARRYGVSWYGKRRVVGTA